LAIITDTMARVHGPNNNTTFGTLLVVKWECTRLAHAWRTQWHVLQVMGNKSPHHRHHHLPPPGGIHLPYLRMGFALTPCRLSKVHGGQVNWASSPTENTNTCHMTQYNGTAVSPPVTSCLRNEQVVSMPNNVQVGCRWFTASAWLNCANQSKVHNVTWGSHTRPMSRLVGCLGNGCSPTQCSPGTLHIILQQRMNNWHT